MGPFHSIAIRQVPAIDKSLLASYRPTTFVRVTSMRPSIGMPAIGIVALPLTVPTSTSVPSDADLNSITKVSLP